MNATPDKDVDLTTLPNTLACQPWELLIPIEGSGINSGVSAVEFKGKLYAFYLKSNPGQPTTIGYATLSKNIKNRLFVESLDELTAKDVAHFRPAVTVYDDHLFCFFTATDQTLRYHVFTGTDWSAVDTVPHTLTADAPSVATHGNRLYLVLRGTVGNVFYHNVFENFSWGTNIPSYHILFNDSPSLCMYEEKPHVAINGLDGQLHVFVFTDNQWRPALRLSQRNLYGAPALHAWAKFIVTATRSSVTHRFLTELIHPPAARPQLYKTAGPYVSPPCLTTYDHDLYLLGQRPCNDLGISRFNPD